MRSLFQSLRSIGRQSLDTRQDEEGGAIENLKVESPQADVFSPSQAVYSAQYPNKWAKIRSVRAPIVYRTYDLNVHIQRKDQGTGGGNARDYDLHPYRERCELPIRTKRGYGPLPVCEGQLSRFQLCLGMRSVDLNMPARLLLNFLPNQVRHWACGFVLASPVVTLIPQYASINCIECMHFLISFVLSSR
jgi:hypothetical protein